MKRKWWIFAIAIILIALVVIVVANNIIRNKENEQTQTEKFKIVTSFYPIYGMVAHLTQNAQNIELTNMTETNVGCLHDYTLTTSDMRQLEDADVLVQNGLGLEDFMDRILQTYPDLKVINSSEEVTNILKENEQNNPHIWTSIQNYTKQVQTIAQKLIEYNPENASIYQANTEQYLQRLEELQNNYQTQLNLEGQKAICLNEALTYLAEELEMDVTTVQTNHEESTLSADSLKDLIINFFLKATTSKAKYLSIDEMKKLFKSAKLKVKKIEVIREDRPLQEGEKTSSTEPTWKELWEAQRAARERRFKEEMEEYCNY